MDTKQLQEQVGKLTAENEVLKNQVEILTSKLNLFRSHSTIANGIKGSVIVSKWVNGVLTTYNAPHDVEIGSGECKIEVKYSKLNIANRKPSGMGTLRWNWSKVFGESGKKKYDRIFLIGEKDDRYKDRYNDEDSEWVIFDVPFGDVGLLTLDTTNKYHSIQLSTNPHTATSKASILYTKYQVTLKDLTAKYNFVDM